MRRAVNSNEKPPKGFLSREEEQELARRWRDHQDESARAKIMKAYHKLAVSFAMKSVRPGLSIEDLIQEANLGLMSALDKFDPDLGFGFATFARYHVISRLQIYTLENLGPVRIFNTATTKSLLARYAQLRHELAGQGTLDGETRSKLCEILEINEDQLTRFEMAVTVTASIDVGAGSDDTETGSRAKALVSEDNPAEETIEKISHEQASNVIISIVDNLNEREATIIHKRHLSDEPATLEKLSELLGISRERVRQIELRTLQKIKKALLERGIDSAENLFG